MTATSRPRVGFVIEQALGHVTYGRNIAATVTRAGDIDPAWIEVPFAPGTRVSRLPFVRNNWTLRGSIEARRMWRAAGAETCDAMFLHTQTVALFAAGLMRKVPSLLSLDATPANFDEVGAAYGHRPSHRLLEALKERLYRRVFATATRYTTWSQWAKDSLARDYGVDPGRVRVLHPGADLTLFPFGRTPRQPAAERPLRLLFVGGDFERKGGDLVRGLIAGPLRGRCELDVVSNAEIAPAEGMRLHRNVGPNSPELLSLYAQADVFVLPTRADCLAVVLGEAMASGLPIITTRVGAHAEAVRDGETGFLLERDDPAALLRAIERFADMPALACAMGQRARAFGEERFDAHKNTTAIAEMLLEMVEGKSKPASHAVADDERGAVA